MNVCQRLHIRHTIDVMHVEKNVSASLLGYILGEKDTVAVRKDMEQVNIKKGLHLQQRGGRGNFVKPDAPYSLRQGESIKFLQTIGAVLTPTGYSSNMGRRVGHKKLQGLKSHDHHVLIQDILPACIRGYLHPGARDAVIRLGHCFKQICTKVVNPADMAPLQQYVAETMCLLEIWFPPAFFDTMEHLILHLVEELKWFGPVHSRWCYGVERYLYVLKQHVRNRTRPEASIAKGHIYADTLGFLSDHLNLYPLHRKMWNPDEDDKNCGEVLEGAPTPRRMEAAEVAAVHEFLLANHADTADMYR